MITITWPTDTTEVIDAIRGAIGRNITINYTVTGVACSNPSDSWDPVTNLSTNQFCPTCNGSYWLNTVSGVTVSAHVTWRPSDINLWYTGGFVVDGECLVQIKYTASGKYFVDNADNFVVDGKVMIKKDVTYRGVPSINRILVTLDQKDK